jgi:hypothetical protein
MPRRSGVSTFWANFAVGADPVLHPRGDEVPHSHSRAWPLRIAALALAAAAALVVPAAAVAAPAEPSSIAPHVGAWGGYSNGQIPASALTYLGRSADGTNLYLRRDAAISMSRMQAAYHAQTGGTLAINEGYRDLATQWYYWNLYQSGQGNVAAYPGTSNHGWALAVDFSLPGNQFSWLQGHAGGYGWSWATGQAAGEPWHWEYVRTGPWSQEPIADWSGDGYADVLAVWGNGELHYYPNNGLKLSGNSLIGHGWGTFRFVTAADWSGDGYADVLGVDAAGDLMYYPHNGNGLSSPVQIGHGFQTFTSVVAADFSGDGHADILAVDAAGDLWYYPHSGNGFGARVQIGHGFGSCTFVL